MKIDYVKNLVKNKNLVVETGTFMGDGVQKFIDCGFERVVSVEINGNLHQQCVERFRGNDSVEIIHGDSVQYFRDNAKNFPEDIFIFLDGHYSGGGTGFHNEPVPLLNELKVILSDYAHDKLIIMIDDVGCWTGLLPDGDPAWDWWKDISEESILKIVSESDFKAKYFYDDEKVTFILDLTREVEG